MVHFKTVNFAIAVWFAVGIVRILIALHRAFENLIICFINTFL
jgi:hypothetical protein